MTQQFNVIELLQDLDAGRIPAKLSAILKETALGVINHGDGKKNGKVSIDFTLSRMKNSNTQINLDHKIKYKRPTAKGKTEGDETDSTTVYVNATGDISIMPHSQIDAFKPKEPA
jgi:hypothetical protein